MKAFLKALCWISAFDAISALDSMQQALMAPPAPSGFGISLTASYGTISVRNSDRSFKHVGRVDGCSQYIEMMRRLSSTNSKHICPPYHSMEEMWDDWPRQAWRSFRKRIGLPASSDVGILSSMLKDLVGMASEHHIDASLDSAVVSFPGLVALCEQDIVDAATYVGLSPVKGQNNFQPREIYAAYAGHGMGLCESFMYKDKCRSEELGMPVRNVLLVEYTKQALLLHDAPLREAVDVLFSQTTGVAASFDLGSSNGGAVPGHADHVKAFVLEHLRPLHRFDEPKPKEFTVIMTGDPDGVGDVSVQKGIERAIEELGTTAVVLTSTSEYVAARGAAELAWRALSLEQRQ